MPSAACSDAIRISQDARNCVDGLVEGDGLVREVGREHVAGQVRARAEDSACPGEHDGADIVGGSLLHRVAQRVDEFGVQCVAPFRALKFDGCDVTDSLDTDHGRPAYCPVSAGLRTGLRYHQRSAR